MPIFTKLIRGQHHPHSLMMQNMVFRVRTTTKLLLFPYKIYSLTFNFIFKYSKFQYLHEYIAIFIWCVSELFKSNIQLNPISLTIKTKIVLENCFTTIWKPVWAIDPSQTIPLPLLFKIKQSKSRQKRAA